MNVDTVSLSNYAEVGYHGWVEAGMLLTGRDSGAQATILSTSLYQMPPPVSQAASIFQIHKSYKSKI